MATCSRPTSGGEAGRLGDHDARQSHPGLGKREHEAEQKSDTVYTYERQYGSFTRSFTLPEGADINLARAS